MEVSWNGGTPKSSILVGFSIIKKNIFGDPPFKFMETPYHYIYTKYILIIIPIVYIPTI